MIRNINYISKQIRLQDLDVGNQMREQIQSNNCIKPHALLIKKESLLTAKKSLSLLLDETQ